jgi:hypothetical protein
MIDAIFDWCVRLLVFLAEQLGMTYKAINVWIFVIIWPVVTLALVLLVVRQRVRIRGLLREIEKARATATIPPGAGQAGKNPPGP